MKNYHSLFLVYFFFAQFPAHAASDGARIVYEIETTHKQKIQKVEGRYFYSQGSARMEITSPQNPMGAMVVLRRADSKQLLMLSPTEKTYFEIPPPQKESSQIQEKEEVPFKSTGEKKTVAGYSCEVMTRKLHNRTEEACVSQELQKDFEMMKAMLSGTEKNSKNLFPKGVEGFPLEVVTKNMRSSSGADRDVTFRVKEFRKEKLSASLFEVPSNYKKEDTSGLADLSKMEELKKKVEEMKQKKK